MLYIPVLSVEEIKHGDSVTSRQFIASADTALRN